MIIDHTNKYIFISVPKTGSISAQFSLGYGHDIPEPHLYHQSIKTALETHPSCVDYYKFAFVRNPWARLVSLYYDFTKKRIYKYSQEVCHDKPLLSEFIDFEDMCLKLHESPWLNDLFFKSQLSMLSVDGKMAMDYVGRFEKLADDFKVICQTIGVEKNLCEMNLGVYDKSSYHKYYTQDSKNAITKLYKEDIEAFDYEF